MTTFLSCGCTCTNSRQSGSHLLQNHLIPCSFRISPWWLEPTPQPLKLYWQRALPGTTFHSFSGLGQTRAVNSSFCPILKMLSCCTLDNVMDALGALVSYVSVFSGCHPCHCKPLHTPGRWGPIMLSSLRACVPPCPIPSHSIVPGGQVFLGVCPAPPSQDDFLVSLHAHCWLVIALPLPLSDWKWSKQGVKRKLMFILSRKAGKTDKHPIDPREVNSRREPRIPPFPGEYFHYSVTV